MVSASLVLVCLAPAQAALPCVSLKHLQRINPFSVRRALCSSLTHSTVRPFGNRLLPISALVRARRLESTAGPCWCKCRPTHRAILVTQRGKVSLPVYYGPALRGAPLLCSNLSKGSCARPASSAPSHDRHTTTRLSQAGLIGNPGHTARPAAELCPVRSLGIERLIAQKARMQGLADRRCSRDCLGSHIEPHSFDLGQSRQSATNTPTARLF